MYKKRVQILLVLIIFLFEKSYSQGTWSNLDSGIRCGDCYQKWTAFPTVYAICPDTVKNVLYVGGQFDTAGNIMQQGISKWDGVEWDSIPNEGFTRVNALIMYHDSLYVGDNGTVFRFNGKTWKKLSTFNGGVHCFGIYKDTLYVGGSFSKNGNKVLNYIAKWDGTDWLPLKGGMSGGSYDEVNTMTVYHDALIVGGLFTMADTIPALSIAKWDGIHWMPLGTGITDWSGSFIRNAGYVLALETFQDKLYVGGDYDSAGGKRAFSIASWSGNQWDTLTIPSLYTAPKIAALKSFNGYLFMNSTGSANYISKYNGISFSTVDSGLNASVYSLGVFGGSLYVGGDFNLAGTTINANAIASWTPDSTSTNLQYFLVRNEQLSIYPNPFLEETTASFSQMAMNDLQFKIFDLTGKEMEKLIIPEGSKILHINRNKLPSGMYFYELLSNGNQIAMGKIIVE